MATWPRRAFGRTLPLVCWSALALHGSLLLPAHASLGTADFLLSRDRWPALMAQLTAADASWTPRAERIPGVGIRYRYRQDDDAPPLSIDQVKALMRHPPNFASEKRAIAALLSGLSHAGVRVALGPPRLQGAAAEWDPRARVVRVRPDVPTRGSLVFARVLNHEAIHVAQSCRARASLRPGSQLLGLGGSLDASARRALSGPLYSQASAAVRALEIEAYSNQRQLDLGVQLVFRHCRPQHALPV